MTTLLGETRPVARMQHTCDGCVGLIPSGQTYVRQRIADSGESWTWKAHLLCHAIADELHRQNPWYDDGAVDPDEMHWIIRDLIGGLLLAPPK